MPRALTKKKDYELEGETTLGEIYQQECQPAGITWEEFTTFNWGTSETRAVNRALVELVGCSELDEGDARRSKVKADLAPEEGKYPIRIPEPWKGESLELQKTHTVKVREILPAPAVAVSKLDRWFIPGDEACRMAYTLDGSEKRADRLALEIYASNYSTAKVAEDGGVEFPGSADLKGTPIFIRDLSKSASPRRDEYPFESWKGESEAEKGVLKKREAGRHVNVAGSPYTVLLRYFKDEADAGARIELAPFWPRFDEMKAVRKESLEIRWKVEGCDRLRHGQLLVWNKDGVVFRQGLSESDLAGGKLTWSAGEELVEPAKMPYRVEIQAHTDMDDAKGVALAVMHTEVRLYAHPELGHEDPLDDAQCLELALADFLPLVPEDLAESDAGRWCGLRLAQLGYHPGPVTGDTGAAAFKTALAELQRSYPKKEKSNGDFQRMEAKGAVTTDVKKVLAEDGPVQPRPRFGKITSGETWEPADCEDSEAASLLNRSRDEHGLIVWADDRHVYTDGPKVDGTDPNIGLENYRGKMSLPGDGKVSKDQASIARPWIPLEVSPRLLSRDQGLDHESLPELTPAMARAIGPLRVDWTFTEVVEDIGLLKTMMEKAGPFTFGEEPKATEKRVRTQAFIKKTIEKLAYKKDGKVYSNCPVKHGGLRPDKPSGLGTYYGELFGTGGGSLAPWKAVADEGSKTVGTLVHDDLGQDEKLLYAGCRGWAGVYFHPSSIAGDGYRVRAQVSFEKLPGGDGHPNLEVLKARYPQLPQAHTPTMRIWRKTSVRGHVLWVHPEKYKHKFGGDWEATLAKVRLHYRACHVHVIHEQGKSQGWKIGEVLEETTFKDIVAEHSKKPQYKVKGNISLDPRHLWPWVKHKHFGITEVPDASVKMADYEEDFLKPAFTDSWEGFRDPLLRWLVDRIEKKTGRYRGHTLVEFDASPPYYKQLYRCDASTSHDVILLEKREVGGSAEGDGCPVSGCSGKLHEILEVTYLCGKCGTVCHRLVRSDAGTQHCDEVCKGTMSLQSVQYGNQGTYLCDTCGTTMDLFQTDEQIACIMLCGGESMTVLTERESKKKVVKGRYGDLPFPAVGGSLGATFVFTGTGPELNWVHEMGHNRHMEHAAGAPGDARQQHDGLDNPDLSGLGGAGDREKQWDRCCIMGYVEKRFFCGKCIFKNRGWKVENLDGPAKEVTGP